MRSLVTALAAIVLAQPAWAGTKYLTHLVPLSQSSPRLSPKSHLLIKESGLLKVVLKDVVSATGSLVTTDKSFANGTLTGDEYVVAIRGRLVSLDIDFELNVIVELKKGKGPVKDDIVAVLALLPGPLVQSVTWMGAKVFGPMIDSESVEACQNNIDAAGGMSLPPAPNPCATGMLVGQSGIVAPE